MRLSEESRVDARTLEVGLVKDRVRLFYVKIDREVAECQDEVVEVHRCLALLDRIGLRPRCILRRYESLRDRQWCGRLIITTAASDERHSSHSYEEWDGEAHRDSILCRVIGIYKQRDYSLEPTRGAALHLGSEAADAVCGT